VRWKARDFLDSQNKPLPQISKAIHGWVGHILLNRSMNIAASATSSAQVQQQSDISGVPTTLFFNSNAMQRLLPDVGPDSVFPSAVILVIKTLTTPLFSGLQYQK
jgi:hypothetical protein